MHMCTYVWVCKSMPWCKHTGQRTTLGSEFSPSTTWVLGLHHPGGKHLYLLSHLASLTVSCLYNTYMTRFVLVKTIQDSSDISILQVREVSSSQRGQPQQLVGGEAGFSSLGSLGGNTCVRLCG